MRRPPSVFRYFHGSVPSIDLLFVRTAAGRTLGAASQEAACLIQK